MVDGGGLRVDDSKINMRTTTLHKYAAVPRRARI